MHAIAYLLGSVFDAVAYLTEISLYVLHATWVTMVNFALAIVETVDDLFPEYEIADNAFWRASILGVVGFLIGVGLMIFLSFALGMWFIPCVFSLSVGFFVFLGIMADPDKDWSLGQFPSWGERREPKVPLNL